MRIFIQFSIIFTEVLLAGLELAGGALLLREYWRRKKQWHLFFMGASLLTVGVGNLFGFAGDFLNAHDASSVGEILTLFFTPSVLVSAVFYAFVFINIYGEKKRRLLYWVVGIAALLSLLIAQPEIMPAFGQLLPVNTVDGFILGYGFWMVVNVGAAIAAGTVYRRKKKAGDKTLEPDRLLLTGSLVTILVAVYTALILSVVFVPGTAAVYLLLMVGIFYKYIGAIAKNHSEQEIVRRPLNVIGGSLTTKVVITCGVAYAVLIFALMSTVTQYFVADSISAQNFRIRSVVGSVAHNFTTKKQLLIDAAEIINMYGECDQALKGNSAETEKLVKVLERSHALLNFYLVNNAGQLVYNLNDDNGVNQSGSDLQGVSLALAGEGPSVSTEYLSNLQAWATLVVSPVTDSSGRTQGAFVISSLIEDHDLPACFSQGLAISGCGFISEGGEVVFSSGQQIDALTTDEFRRAIGLGSSRAEGQNERFSKYFVELVDVSGGEGGFYYAFVSQEDTDREIARLLSSMVLITGVFFLLFAFLLIFGLRLLLRPLLMLKTGAERLARGDYDYRIDYDSADEIGQLAKSFNTMSDTIQHRTAKLNQKMDEQRDFLSNTAHEIRTPLNIFRWSLEMLRFGDMGPLNNEQMELLENMNQTNGRIRKLVSDLLEVSRLEQGHIKLERVPLHLEDLIDEVAGSFAVRMREKKVDFYWKHPENRPPQARGDWQRLIQVLTNVLSNAVKFTDDGGHIGITLERVDELGRQSDLGQFLMVSVEDNGRGIPKKEQKLIFGRFYRASNATEGEVEGTGLGMFLSKQYVEMHGGRIWFESKHGSGTTFHFTVPINKD